MSLNRARLRRSLTSWFQQPEGIRSSAQAEQKFAEVYHEYAREGEDVSGERAGNLSAARFRAQLHFQWSRTAKESCLQLDRAFVAYWTGAVFAIAVVPPASPPCPNVGGSGVFASETSSAVVAVQARVLYSKLLPILSTTSNTAARAAAQVAEALDEATKQAVSVRIDGTDTTPGPGGPLPIFNLCTVF